MYTIVYTLHIIYTTRYQVLTKYGAVYKSARAVPDSSTSTSSTVSETEIFIDIINRNLYTQSTTIYCIV